MARSLVLRNGRFCEELDEEVGLYPRLHLVDGRIIAGGTGNDLVIQYGRIRERVLETDCRYVETGYWLDGYGPCEEISLDCRYVQPGYWADGYGPCEEVSLDCKYVETGYWADGYGPCEN